MTRVSQTAVFALAVVFFGILQTVAVRAADKPKDRVVAMYFHRTERCPTCKKMGSYSEEAVKKGFANQLKQGTVAFYSIDFQAKKNAAFTKGYHVTGPALVIAKIRDNKVDKHKTLDEIWAKAGDKPAFLKYVQENVRAYLD